MSDILKNLVSSIENKTGQRAKKSGNGYRLLCPAHHGKNHNLYVADGNAKLIIKCHSHQCDPKEIVEATGLTLSDIYYERTINTNSDRQACQTIKHQHQIKRELATELLILLFWLCDSWREVFPVNDKADIERVQLAWRRVHAAAGYFSKVGVR